MEKLIIRALTPGHSTFKAVSSTQTRLNTGDPPRVVVMDEVTDNVPFEAFKQAVDRFTRSTYVATLVSDTLRVTLSKALRDSMTSVQLKPGPIVHGPQRTTRKGKVKRW